MKKLKKAFAITDAKISFVSLVDAAANKHKFLITKQEDGKAGITTYGKIIKADAESHYVTGIVYEPMVEDTDGNFMTEEEIIKAAYWFAKNGDKVDLQHNFEPLSGATVVETWVAKADFEIEDTAVKKGTWLITVEITDDSVWKDIHDGKITGFSMGGVGQFSEEDTDLDNANKSKNTSKVEYATTAVRLPWEITGETLRENIEGAGYESVVADLMSRQVGVDLEDLSINGDEGASPGDDYDFLKINNGWINQIEEGGHVYDATDARGMSIEMFYKALGELPNKYNNGKLRWIMSPRRSQEWEMYLLNRVITAGGSVPDSLYDSPAKIPVLTCANMPDDKILLTDPKNLITIHTYDMQIRKTNEGKEAVMKDVIYYVIHLDFDPVIEELDATAIIKGIGGATDATS